MAVCAERAQTRETGLDSGRIGRHAGGCQQFIPIGTAMTVLLKPLRGGRPVVIDKPIVLVGRHPDCDFIITDSPKISRKHCCLALVNSQLFVRDLESMNGVWVNEDRVEQLQDLSAGDELMIGDVAFEVVQPQAAITANASGQSNPESLEIDATLDELGEGRDEEQPRNPMQKTRFVGEDGHSVDMSEVAGSEKVEFSSAMALPNDSQDDDFVVPFADLDD